MRKIPVRKEKRVMQEKMSQSCMLLLSLIVATFFVFSLSATAATRTIKDGVSNWTLPSSYDENAVPTANDSVVLLAGRTVTLDSSDDASWALAESLNRIVPTGTNSVFIVNVDSNDAMLTVPFSSSNVSDSNHTNGCLRKTGGGNLFLGKPNGEKRYVGGSATGEGYDYFSRIEAIEGAVTFPQEVDRGGTFRYGVLYIANGAVISNVAVKSGVSEVYPNIQVCGLFGSGTVSSAGKRALQIAGTGVESSVFDGKISGSLVVQQNGKATYTSTQSDSSGAFQVRLNYSNLRSSNAGGIAHVASFGGEGESSSVGSYRIEVGQHGGGFVYEGKGERVGKSLWLRDEVNTPGVAFLDGGKDGGLEWAGAWKQTANSATETKTHRVYLIGSHTNECVMSGPFEDTKYQNVMYPIYIVKRGSGIWRMADNVSRTCGGGYAIEEGILRYDSIAEKGIVCSLGTATNLTENYTGRDLEGHRRDYAYLLGSSAGGTMEFTGLNGGTCSTRPVAVKGKGRFKVSGAGKFSFSRFFAYEPGAELVLDTDRVGNDVFIGGVADGAAPLDVAKEGSGTIALIGPQSFTGNLTVRSGTLVVCGYKREKYTWFRWTIKETALHCARYSDQFDTTGAEQLKMMMQEFALFDADGRRVNVGHSENRDAKADVTLLSPGEVTIQGNSWPTVGGKLNELYNGVQWESGADWYGMSISSGDFPGYRMSVPASYKYVVERLPTDANEVASYDLAYAYGTNFVNKGGWGITAFSLEGSTDGVHWSAPLVDRSDCVVPYENFRWLSSPDSPLNTHRGKKDGNEVTYFDDHRGFAVDGFCVSGSSNVIETVGMVSVSTNATLRADGDAVLTALRLSPHGNGTIEGFTFAESGVLDVAAEKISGVTVLPVTLQNCKNVQSMSHWTLKVGGIDAPRYKIKMSASGEIMITPPGMIISIR